MNPIKKLNEKIDFFISGIMKNDKSSNVELIVFFALFCFALGLDFACMLNVFETFHEEPIRTVLDFVSVIFIGYIMLRILFGKNQLVSEIMKRMEDKELKE